MTFQRAEWRSVGALKRAVQVLAVIAVFVGLCLFAGTLGGDDLDRAGVVTAAVAATAGALAAGAAWRTAKLSEQAAKYSALTAENATQALALATRPDPGFNISMFSPGSVSDGTAAITLENRAHWPLVDPVIRWSCRGGVEGALHLSTRPARSTPYGGSFLHAKTPVVHEVTDIDITRPGVDKVTVEFGTQYGPQRWTVTKGFVYGLPKSGGVGPELVDQIEPVVRAIESPSIAR